MNPSQFLALIVAQFAGIVTGVTTRLNGRIEGPLSYLHKTMLQVEYSVSGKWESFFADNTQVAADIVAMDSPLPLKKRDSMGRASGDIPKQGQERQLNERELTDLGVLRVQNGTQNVIIQRIFADTPKVITAIYERNEACFLEGLSTGMCVVSDANNVGAGVRLDFGYPTANKFGVTALWSNVASTPIDDIQRMVSAASDKGESIIRILMDRTAFNNMVKTTQVKQAYAYFAFGSVGQVAPTPTLSKANELLNDTFGFGIQIIDRSVRTERDGVQTAYKPWADGAVVGITSEQVGKLVYARLAEQDSPVAGVTYQETDSYILVSKFSVNRPSLAEFTQSQARVIPVISTSVYLLDSKTIQV